MRLSLKVIKRRKNGRFDQRDSYMGEHGNPISENRYTYVWNNPSKYIDPSGNAPSSIALGGKEKFDNLVAKDFREYGWSKTYQQSEFDMSVKYKSIGDWNPLGAYAQYIFVQVYNQKRPGNAPPPGPLKDNENGWGGNAPSTGTDDYARDEAIAAEAARNAANEKEMNDIITNLNGRDIDIPDMDGLSIEQKLRILREIKRICDEIEDKYGKWDDAAKEEAQKKNDEIDVKKEDKNGFLNVLEKVFQSTAYKLFMEVLLDVVLFLGSFIPFLGSLLSIVMGIMSLSPDNIWALWDIVSVVLKFGVECLGLITGGVATIATAIAKIAASIEKFGDAAKSVARLINLLPGLIKTLKMLHNSFEVINNVKEPLFLVYNTIIKLINSTLNPSDPKFEPIG